MSYVLLVFLAKKKKKLLTGATNTADLFLPGLRTKHPCSQVWRKVNYGLRSTGNFQTDILKMSLPSFSPVYHNGIMSLHFIKCNISSFPVFLHLLSYSTTPKLSQLELAEVSRKQDGSSGWWVQMNHTQNNFGRILMGIWKERHFDLCLQKDKEMYMFEVSHSNHIHTKHLYWFILHRAFISKDNMGSNTGFILSVLQRPYVAWFV